MIVLWRITTLCNLACGFCAYDRRVPQQRVHVPIEEIERVAALLAAYQASSGAPVLLSWLGGEPLLYPGLVALSKRLRGDGLRVSMTTNGTRLPADDRLQAIADAFDEITFSIDGIGGTHDRLRGWTGGERHLAQVMPALSALRGERKRLRLRANVVLMRDNLSQFSTLCLQLAQWGVDEITFNQLGGRDRPHFHADQALTVRDVQSLRQGVPSLVEALAHRGVRLHASPDYLHRLHASAMGQALAVSECETRRPTIFIDEHSQVAPCSFTTQAYGMPTTALQTIADVASLRARLAARRHAAPAAVCNDCPSTQVFSKFGTNA
jgi:sulfatase maturation enzyme AslB (radical SAM superfamily)